MDPVKLRKVGRTGLYVTQLGFGSLGIGSWNEQVSEPQAHRTVNAAYDAGVRFFDTAPWYGLGLSEDRLGGALYDRPRSEWTVASKVGRRLVSRRQRGLTTRERSWGAPFEVWFDYTYDGIMRSYEDSLHRLRTDVIEAVFIHDLDERYHQPVERLAAKTTELLSSGWRALQQLKETAGVQVVGAGINDAASIPRMLDLVDVDALVVAGPYTLLHQEVLDREFKLCEDRGVALIIGSVFQSGLLVTRQGPSALYNYSHDIPATVMGKVAAIEEVCASFGVPVAAAALQFPLGHPLVVSVLPGGLSPEQVRQNCEYMRTPIPAALWEGLKRQGLLHPDAPVPHEEGRDQEK